MDKIWETASKSPVLTTILASLGGLWTSYQLYKLGSFMHFHFLRRSALDRYKKDASWALITGSSDGIGKGFAEELCNRGFNVILHGRNAQKLEAVKDALLTQWPQRQIRIVVFDAGHETGNVAKLEAAIQELDDLNITVLVNNVGGTGGAQPSWLPLEHYDVERTRMFIDLNARFATELTRILLPKLIKHSPALILNVGSLAGEVPAPYLSVYGGSKAFNKSWSRGLSLEMKAEGHDIEVLLVTMAMVSSGSQPIDTSFLVPSSRQMAQASLDKVGCGEDHVVGYWPHALQFKFATSIPDWLSDKYILSIANEEKAKELKGMKEQ